MSAQLKIKERLNLLADNIEADCYDDFSEIARRAIIEIERLEKENQELKDAIRFASQLGHDGIRNTIIPNPERFKEIFQ